MAPLAQVGLEAKGGGQRAPTFLEGLELCLSCHPHPNISRKACRFTLGFPTPAASKPSPNVRTSGRWSPEVCDSVVYYVCRVQRQDPPLPFSPRIVP